jgi:uncharacterized protein Smg (DUF494 family)
MYERIVDIITYVLSELKQNKKLADIDLNILRDKGYSSSEISTAFSWLVDRIEFNNPSQPLNISDVNSFRILHDAEKELFTEFAWGELVQMQSLGIINTDQIEQIIERALLSGVFKIDSFFLKNMIASFIFNATNSTTPGSRILLSGNDSIN